MRLPSQAVALVDVTKRFEGVTAVDDVTLEVASGEFFSLLGPSGCGKTTSLRMVAGFERPDVGRIVIGETDVTDVPPHRRPVNTVFQSYALFPHLTVEQNVAFGLRFQDIDRNDARRRVRDVLELVRLHGLERRRPHQLSGGQQQRVALARALVLSPAVLLLDEPLGALDAKLRRDLQVELKSIQREIGITFVYVTHDQEEALTMSDRLAVMARGKIEQIGTPREVYEHPATAFVADFLGVSNLMRGHLLDSETVEVGGVRLRALGGGRPPGVVRLTIRPERVRISAPGTSGENCVAATIERFVYLGSTTQVFVTLPGGDRVQALVANSGDVDEYDVGAAVTAQLPRDALRVLADDEAPA
ncbi:MAG: polyamine-transporting ATPase [Gaiellaceae bacterium]|nr:MAG: polyamine-transporting ATPase [Gaiellaceae bacterium]